MAYTTRVGELYLLKNVEWTKDYKHTKYFSSASAQFNYITDSSRIIGSSNPKTAQNQIKNPLSGTIKVGGMQENYLGCSYICWKNTPIEGSLPADHTYNYAFVDDVRYISNGVFEIDYTIDVFQTYLFQGGCEIEKAFIKRTHTQDDTKGKYLEPEPVSFSDYTVEKLSSLIVDTNFTWVVYAPFDVANPPSWGTDGAFPVKMSGMAGGVLQGLQARAYTSYTDMEADIENMDSRLAEKIVAIVGMPAGFIQSGGTLGVVQPNIKTEASLQPSDIDGYTPLNNKLWCAPYNTLLLSNTHGGNRTLKFEYFQSQTLQFKLILGIAPNPELLCAPIAYGKGFSGTGNEANYAEAISITDFPHCAWTGNGYLSWFATTGQHQIVNTVGSLLNPLQWLSLGENMAHFAIDAGNASMTSPKSYGSTGGSTALMAGDALNFYTYQQCVNKRDAYRIDNFFSRYGYAINQIGTVHFTNPRFNQHYVETGEIIIKGGAPASVIKTMCDAFNSGITFWKNSVGNYTVPTHPN